MHIPTLRSVLLPLLAVALLPAGARADDGTDFFEKKVRPVLADHCYSCHSGKKEKGGLRLDTADAIRKGGDSGALFTKGDDGLLLKAVEHAADAPAMPPKGKLPDAARADIRKWVKMGAPLPAATVAKSDIGADPRQFWSFVPVVEQAAPKVSDPKWPTRKSDYFVLKALDDRQMKPAPAADRRTLVRRVYFDLIGLPPTFEQVETFVADERPDAYEKLVDELLASPRFGEKWARHWLDVARYAEDNPTGESTCRPPRFPFRYRDWVIGAFNADLPFDRFVKLQLAADLAPGTKPEDYAGLGFLGLSPVYHKEPKLSKAVISEIVADEWDERVDAITRGFLGLTVACARCHDHKFDPISTKDYYALAGVLANTQLAERPLRADAAAAQDTITTVRRELLDANLRLSYAKEMRGTAVKEKRDPRPFDKSIKDFEARVAELQKKEKTLEAGPTANVVRDAGTWVNGDDPAWTVIDYKPGQFRDLPVFVRGNPARPGAVASRQFLSVLSRDAKPFVNGSGRLELADAITADAAGLTARVFVNRVWGWVFGKPLVATPSNFGSLGERPTHPELLDDLAARFVESRRGDRGEPAGGSPQDRRGDRGEPAGGAPQQGGWSVKWLVRELVLSAAYRQSDRHDPAFAATDPDDRWLWRAPRKRLELEAWRDAMLAVSGQLDLAGGGPSDDLDSPRSVRRTVFGKVSRERPSDIHRLFDLPDPKAHGEKRESTTTPVQQLYFLNSPFVRRAAEKLAATVPAGASAEEGARALFRRVLLRDPTPAELKTATGLVAPHAGDAPAWGLLAQALLTSNEFLYLN